MTLKPYGVYCPISKACEVLEPRWTIQILTELWSGSTRFNEIRRGVPGISPSLLSKRLKDMEQAGLIEKVEDPATGAIDYLRTDAAIELEPVLDGLGAWAQRHVAPDVALAESDAPQLMWQLRRKVDPEHLPDRRTVVRFHFTDVPGGEDKFWLVVRPGVPVDLCRFDPGYEVDLYVETEVRSLVAVFLGRSTSAREVEEGRLFFSGSGRLSRSFDRWLRQSNYARTPGIAKATAWPPRPSA
ncbi:winged helix-turn-helix transcriptional regulator [Halovulum sp. GXIMD14794]